MYRRDGGRLPPAERVPRVLHRVQQPRGHQVLHLRQAECEGGVRTAYQVAPCEESGIWMLTTKTFHQQQLLVHMHRNVRHSPRQVVQSRAAPCVQISICAHAPLRRHIWRGFGQVFKDRSAPGRV